MAYYCILLKNYHAYDETFYFENEQLAKESFLALKEQVKGFDEFEEHDDEISWFDPNYNEYSTYASIEFIPLPPIHNKPIVNWE